MKKSPKTKKVVINVDRSFSVDQSLLKMTFLELNDHLGGKLATALFKGEFYQKLYDAMYVAGQWGGHAYHQELLKDGRGD